MKTGRESFSVQFEGVCAHLAIKYLLLVCSTLTITKPCPWSLLLKDEEKHAKESRKSENMQQYEDVICVIARKSFNNCVFVLKCSIPGETNQECCLRQNESASDNEREIGSKNVTILCHAKALLKRAIRQVNGYSEKDTRKDTRNPSHFGTLFENWCHKQHCRGRSEEICWFGSGLNVTLKVALAREIAGHGRTQKSAKWEPPCRST